MATLKNLLSSTLESFLTSKKSTLATNAQPSSNTITIVSEGATGEQLGISYTPPADGWLEIDDMIPWGQNDSTYIQGTFLSYLTGCGRQATFAPCLKGMFCTINSSASRSTSRLVRFHYLGG